MDAAQKDSLFEVFFDCLQQEKQYNRKTPKLVIFLLTNKQIKKMKFWELEFFKNCTWVHSYKTFILRIFES